MRSRWQSKACGNLKAAAKKATAKRRPRRRRQDPIANPTPPCRSPSGSPSRATSCGPATTTALVTANSASARSRPSKHSRSAAARRPASSTRRSAPRSPPPRSQAGGGRLAHGRRRRERRAPRHSDQAGAAGERDRGGRAGLRRAARCRSRHSDRAPGTTLAAEFERMQKEPPAARSIQRDARRFLHRVGLAGPQEGLRPRARARTAKCAASPSCTTRRWKASWIRSWSRCRARSLAFPTARRRPPPRRKVEYGTGIVVGSPEHIVTTARRPRLPGDHGRRLGPADRVAEDKTTGLALLRVLRRAISRRPRWRRRGEPR